MIRMLVSARDVAEAREAALAGADFVDLKEPSAGALGAVAPKLIRECVASLRGCAAEVTISATVGDLPVDDAASILAAVECVWACGVDLVKVGMPGAGEDLAVAALLDRLAHCGIPVVPVLLVDHGLDLDRVAHACGLGFPAIMVDTQGKLAGSVIAHAGMHLLAAASARARACAVPFGLAGALSVCDLDAVVALAPDFAGFRSAVCAGVRSARLDPERVRSLRNDLDQAFARAAVSVTRAEVISAWGQ